MSIRLTDREAQVMDVLWSRGPSTVSEVRAELSDELAYTTVLTVLRTLEGKGYVRHERDGRAHRYGPSIDRETAQRNASQALVNKLFRGSTELLLTQLVADEALDEDELERVRRLIDQHAKSRGIV